MLHVGVNPAALNASIKANENKGRSRQTMEDRDKYLSVVYLKEQINH